LLKPLLAGPKWAVSCLNAPSETIRDDLPGHLQRDDRLA
jgi:hypothetical protein